MSFSNKVVIVTGAASDIGAAISRSFAKQHVNLCVVDINEESVQKIKEECGKLSQGKVFEVIANLATDDGVEKAVQYTLKNLGKIDVLINCAGIYQCIYLDGPKFLEKFDKLTAINLRSVVAMTVNALPALIESKGCVINISSSCTTINTLCDLANSVAKAGVNEFTKSAALELAKHGVRVNSLSPGAVKTNIYGYDSFSETEVDKIWDKNAKATPLQKCVEPDEVAELTVFLASDKAASVTGADFVIDGGLMLSAATGILNVPVETKSNN